MNTKTYFNLFFQSFIFCLCVSFSTQNEECKIEKGNVSKKEDRCTTTTTTIAAATATTTTKKYGLIELESLFIGGEPDPQLVDVPKLFFLEVITNYHIINFSYATNITL